MATELRRAMQSFGAGRPNGERALVVAIIGYTARDAADGDAAAARWFLSADYRWYLSLLGLPPEWLPAGVTRADLAGLVEAAASRRSARATSAGAATPSGTGPGRGARRSSRAAPMSQIVTG